MFNKDKKFYEEVDKQAKKKGCFIFQNCCLTIFILFVIFIFFVTGAVASTGLVKIPFFSSVFYQEPNPSEVVTPKQVDEKYIIEKLANSSIDNEGRISLELNSEEISGLVNYLAKNSDTIDKNQVFLLDNKAELFFKLQKPILSYITLELGPDVIKNKQLAIKLHKFKIGNLRMPMFIVSPILDIYMSNNDINLKFSPEFEITDLKIENNRIKLSIKLSDKNTNLENLLLGDLDQIGDKIKINSSDVDKYKSLFGEKIPTQEELEKFFGGDLPSEEEQEKFKKEIENSIK